jgi:hypothetical protein
MAIAAWILTILEVLFGGPSGEPTLPPLTPEQFQSPPAVSAVAPSQAVYNDDIAQR